MMTAMQGYKSPYWLTFKQANDFGASVKKGEKGTPIVYWGKFDRELESGETKSSMFLKHFTVFNVEQIEGLKHSESLLYPGLRQIDFNPIDAAQKIVDNSQCKPRLEHVKQRAYYSPSLDYINMPAPQSFSRSEEYYSTLFHELTHSTGHESRLKRKSLTEVAEIGSAYLCSLAGFR